MKKSKVKRLLLDVDNLSHRNWYAMQNVDLGDRVYVGMIRDIITFVDVTGLGEICFCFDSGDSLRKKIYPAYKSNRHYGEVGKSIDRQIRRLRTDILPKIGFKNLFSMPGYEADDVIGFLVREPGEFVIVSNDQDYYQLLSPRVSIWDPFVKREITEEWVKEKYGVKKVSDLLRIKSICGCPTDNIRGVVGEASARSYVLGKKVRESKRQAIEDGGIVIQRNLSLIQLPYHALPNPYFTFSEDVHTEERWREVTDKLKCFNMVERYPWRNIWDRQRSAV